MSRQQFLESLGALIGANLAPRGITTQLSLGEILTTMYDLLVDTNRNHASATTIMRQHPHITYLANDFYTILDQMDEKTCDAVWDRIPISMSRMITTIRLSGDPLLYNPSIDEVSRDDDSMDDEEYEVVDRPAAEDAPVAEDTPAAEDDTAASTLWIVGSMIVRSTVMTGTGIGCVASHLLIRGINTTLNMRHTVQRRMVREPCDNDGVDLSVFRQTH